MQYFKNKKRKKERKRRFMRSRLICEEGTRVMKGRHKPYNKLY